MLTNPKQSMGLVYLPTFTIQISQMWATIPYMDDMGMGKGCGATKKKKLLLSIILDG